MVWLDLDRPTAEVMAALQEEFGFHELAIDDSLTPHQRPKAEQYDDYYFLVCYLAGGELDQIQFLLGHVSIQTTERYLGCKQKLSCAVNDTLGIEPG